MNTFGEFFKKYIDISKLPDSINNSELLNISVNSDYRGMDIHIGSEALIDRQNIFQAESMIRSSILNLAVCYLYPHYDSTLFDLDYYPQLILELKRRNATLNGTLNDSSVSIEGNRLILELKHGGKDFLSL